VTPYRSPAPHVCKYDVLCYMPPHHVYYKCVCGTNEPPSFAERVLDAVFTVLIDPLNHQWTDRK
jgi:hypothetical protein